MTVANILSVDVEDWFHICGIEDRIPKSIGPRLGSRVNKNTLDILEILAKNSIQATFFVLGVVAEKHPDLIKKIGRAGHEIATHGYAHQRVYTMTPEKFRQDVKKAVDILFQITGRPVKGYRAPEWSIRNDSLWALDILQQEGFEYDSSMAPLPLIGHSSYSQIPCKLKLNTGFLLEFPPFVAVTALGNLPMGGGWGLRVFPYNLIRFFIRKRNDKGWPALIFLHPREFDENNPRIRLPLVKQFVLNARLERTGKRLNRLLKDFSFISIADFMFKNQKNIAIVELES